MISRIMPLIFVNDILFVFLRGMRVHFLGIPIRSLYISLLLWMENIIR